MTGGYNLERMVLEVDSMVVSWCVVDFLCCVTFLYLSITEFINHNKISIYIKLLINQKLSSLHILYIYLQ